MISAELLSPDSTTDPGILEFIIRVVVDDDIDSILANSSWSINGVDSVFSYAEAEGNTRESHLLARIQGPQELLLSFSTHKSNGEKLSKIWNITVNGERTSRVQDYPESPYLEEFTKYIPDSLKAYTDPNSVFKQLLNPIALKLAKIEKNLIGFTRMLDINNESRPEADWLYEIPLDEDELQDLHSISVFGIKGVNKIELTRASEVNDLWESIPTRFLNTESVEVNTDIIIPRIEINQLAQTVGVPIKTKSYLWFEVDESLKLIDLIGNQISQTSFVITGLSPEGANQTEIVQFTANGSVRSRKRWSFLGSIKISSLNPMAEGFVTVHMFKPRKVRLADQVDKASTRNGREPIRWDIVGDSIFRKLISAQGFVLDLAKGEDTSLPTYVCNLVDVDNAKLEISDFAIWDNFVVGTDLDNIYIWDKRPPVFSQMHELGSTDYPEQDFELGIYNLPGSESFQFILKVEVEKSAPRGRSPISEYYWEIISPDGTSKYLNPSSGEISERKIIIRNGVPLDYFGIKEPNFELEIVEPGDYIINLYTTLTDSTQEKAQRTFRLEQRRAISQYPLRFIIGDCDAPPRIDIVDGFNLAVLVDGYCHRFAPSSDIYMIDPENKTLFTKDEYDLIEVSDAN